MEDSVRLWKGSQSLEGERTLQLETGQKIRAKAKRDAYDSQSWVKVDVWSDDVGWAFLTSWPISDFELAGFSYGTRQNSWKDAARAALTFAVHYAIDFFDEGE